MKREPIITFFSLYKSRMKPKTVDLERRIKGRSPVRRAPAARKLSLDGAFRQFGYLILGSLLKGSYYLGCYVRVPYFRNPP